MDGLAPRGRADRAHQSPPLLLFNRQGHVALAGLGQRGLRGGRGEMAQQSHSTCVGAGPDACQVWYRTALALRRISKPRSKANA